MSVIERSLALEIADGLESCGEGCYCYASSAYECGCEDAIWPDYYAKDAAHELRRLYNQKNSLIEELQYLIDYFDGRPVNDGYEYAERSRRLLEGLQQ